MTANSDMPGTPPAPNERFAGFQIERTLGRGGLGTVVLARDAHGVATALKLVDLGGAEGKTLAETFEREVVAARRLQHPRIVRVHETGRVGDIAYIAMEYVGGGDLGAILRRDRPSPLRQALQIVADVAEALAHAHGQGILHRDIKPANVLLEPGAGRAKLADFGLARLSDMQRSRTGVLAGTPAYMSPEQLAEGVQDVRADLYSLGVLLFELVTGRLPYEAESLGALLRQVSRSAAPPIGVFRADAPAGLSVLVERLLEKDRARRPSDAQAVAGALEAILAALPDDAQPGRGPEAAA